jgi:hypothetical protein
MRNRIFFLVFLVEAQSQVIKIETTFPVYKGFCSDVLLLRVEIGQSFLKFDSRNSNSDVRAVLFFFFISLQSLSFNISIENESPTI